MKRTSLWSNSKMIGGFWKGVKLAMGKRDKTKSRAKTTTKYVDKEGRQRWTGTPALTRTGNPVCAWLGFRAAVAFRLIRKPPCSTQATGTELQHGPCEDSIHLDAQLSINLKSLAGTCSYINLDPAESDDICPVSKSSEHQVVYKMPGIQEPPEPLDCWHGHPRICTRAFATRAVELVRAQNHRMESSYPQMEAYEGEARKIFSELGFADMAEDAKLVELAHYLRGCTGLAIPTEWRPLLPTRL